MQRRTEAIHRARACSRKNGITRGQRCGKLWVVWSDAREEAGLSPNTVPAELDLDTVLDCYEEACRHFQRVPTSAERRFYARERPEFVGVHSFRRIFGDVSGVNAALRERAVERGDAELLVILPEVTASPNSPQSPISTGSSEGWVYLLQSGDYYKTGRSDELEKRVKQISIALPERVALVHAIRTDDPQVSKPTGAAASQTNAPTVNGSSYRPPT